MTHSPWHKALRCSLRALSHWLWPPTPEQEERDYQTRLAQELQIRQQLMVDLCRRTERWRDRLERLHRHELHLVDQIQTHTKLCNEEETQRSARALERVRQAQTRLRERLQRAEKKYQQAQFRFQQLKQERASALPVERS